MPIFTYKARNGDGELITGELEAETAVAVKYRLADQGLYPTQVDKKDISISLPSFFKFRKKVKQKELIGFTRQFAALFKAGITMDRILSNLSKQAQSENFKKVIEGIRKDVMSGTSLTGAFAKYPDYFSELYVNMLNVGEQAGLLDATLKELSNVLEKEHRIISAIKSATLYPKIVIVAFILVMIVIVTVVIPGFADFYGGFDAKLPLPTRILMGISDFFVDYWYVMIIIVISLIVAFKRFISTKTGRLKFDAFKFKVPVFGKLNKLVSNARFGHLFSALYKAGVPVAHSLHVVGNAIGNKAYKEDVDAVCDAVEKGSSLATAMADKPFFTPMMIETIDVGEQTGSLDDMLATTANFYDEEASDMLDKLATLIEPLLLIGLFAMVALLAFAVFLPMWETTKLILPDK